MGQRARVLLGVTLAASLPVSSPAQQDSLVARLRAVASPLTLTPAGDLAGPGGEVLAAGVREARFVMIGEEHGVAEVPQLARALWRAGQAHGYTHFAIEVGEQLAVRLETALRADTTGAAYLQFLGDHWPGTPFYFWREDAALLRVVTASTAGRRGVLWGLDYDILGDRHLLARLRQIAPSADARRVADSAKTVTDSALARALREQNPGLFYMFGGSPDLLARLRSAFTPVPGSEVDRILSLMEETLAINRLFLTRQGYESNVRRSSLLKRQFLRHYDSTRAADGRSPKVMLKFGASHLVRGRNFANTFDLGTVVPEVAEQEGGTALGILVIGGPGTTHAQVDPRVLRSVEAPVEPVASEWGRVFGQAADPERWTVFDLRPLRRQGRFGPVPPDFTQVLYGFDLVVVLSRSGPQHDLLPARP